MVPCKTEVRRLSRNSPPHSPASLPSGLTAASPARAGPQLYMTVSRHPKSFLSFTAWLKCYLFYQVFFQHEGASHTSRSGSFWCLHYGLPSSTLYPGEGNGNPLQYGLENPMDRGPWQATAHGDARVRYDLAPKPPPPCAYDFSQPGQGPVSQLLSPVSLVS